MIILYTNFDFYIPEHIAFLTYSVIFTVFITVHTYDHWEEPDVNPCESYNEVWDSEQGEEGTNQDSNEIAGFYYIG